MRAFTVSMIFNRYFLELPFNDKGVQIVDEYGNYFGFWPTISHFRVEADKRGGIEKMEIKGPVVLSVEYRAV